MNTSEILNTAADLIEERGWSKGPASWNVGAGTPLCMEGGILAALGGSKCDRAVLLWREGSAYHALADYLECPNFGDDGGTRNVWSWNDARGRTAAEVIEALRAAAAIEESREALAAAGVSA